MDGEKWEVYRAWNIRFGPPQCQEDIEKSEMPIPDQEMWLVNGNENSEGNEKLSKHVLVTMEFYKQLKHKPTNHN